MCSLEKDSSIKNRKASQSYKVLVARNRVAAMALLNMRRFRKYFGDRPARLASRPEVEEEGKRGFRDTSSFSHGL